VEIISQIQRDLTLNPELLSKMEWLPRKSSKMREFVDTPRFLQLFKMCAPDEVPLCILLYIDGFLKFHALYGSAISIYYSFLNAPKSDNAKLSNIEVSAICKTNLDVWFVIKEICDAFQKHPIIDIQLPSAKFLKAKLFVALGTFDMPQRHKNLNMMSIKSPIMKCFRCKVPGDKMAANEIFPLRDDWKLNLKEYISLAAKNDPKDKKRRDELVSQGVRLWYSDKSGKTFLATSIPFFNFSGFDPISHTVVDLFHVEIIGLLKLNLDCIYAAIVPERMAKVFKSICAKYKIDIAGKGNWNGDQLLLFMMESCFILEEYCGMRMELKHHVDCWKKHLKYLIILLREEISNEEVDECLEIWKDWKKDFEQIYAMGETERPNFHAVYHCILDIKNFGPPISYWTRNFEHKHKEMREIIEGSNFKNVEEWCLYRVEKMKTLQLQFPFMKGEFEVRSSSYSVLSVGDFIQVPGDNIEKIARIVSLSPAHLNVELFQTPYPKHPKIEGAIDISKLKGKEGKSHAVLYYKMIAKRYRITNGFINPFGVLNFVKFKIPKF